MSITNYGELKTAIANWLERDDLTSRIPEFIALAEDRIGLDTRIRIRAMEASADLNINAQTVALPAGYVEARRLYLDASTPKLDYLTPEDFWSRSGSRETGTPKFFTAEGENFVFGPAPGSPLTGKLLYWKKFTSLSADPDTNWLLTNARGLYLYGALLEASPYLGEDSRALTWASLWDDLADNVQKADKRDRHSGAPLTMKSDVPVW